MTRMLSFWLLVSVIVVLCIVFYRVMAGFLVPLFLAALLVVIFGPLHKRILARVNGRRRTAAALTTAAVLLLVLVPMSLLIAFAALEGRDVISRLDFGSLKQKTSQLRSTLDLSIEHQAELTAVENELAELGSKFSKDRIGFQKIEFRNLAEARWTLAEKLKLPVDPPAEEAANIGLFGTQQRRAEQSWERFSWSYSQMNELLTQTDWQEGEPDAIQESLFEYEQRLFDAAHRFRDFKTELLGGRFKAWAKEVANPTPDELATYSESINGFVQKHIVSFGGATFEALVRLLVGAAIMTIALYFFLLDGDAMIKGFMFLSPLDDRHEAELLEEFGRVSRAVVLATLLSAVAQGLLAGIGFYFAGLNSIFLLMLLSTGLALIPFVGAASVWIPCCLWLYFVDGRLWPALLLAVYGFAVISMVDNFIKPLVLHGQSNLHPLLALLSVLGGVTSLGPIGILVGPMVVVFLQTLLKILQRELSLMDATSEKTDDAQAVEKPA